MKLLMSSLLFLFLSCTLSSVEISRIDDLEPAHVPAPINFSQNIELDHPDFSKALLQIAGGDYSAAVKTFNTLSIMTDNPELKRKAEKAAINLMFNISAWDLLSDISLSRFHGDTTGKYLAMAYATGEIERYVFKSGKFEIPMKLSASGSPLIGVIVNGEPFVFWLDTGAGLSVVSSRVAEICGIKPIDTSHNTYAVAGTGKKIPVKPVIIKEVKIGDLTILNHPAMLINEDDLTFKLLKVITVFKIDGIIGWNAIRNLDIEIDYENEKTTIRHLEKRNIDRRNFFWFFAPTVSLFSIGHAPLYFSLDTGANRTTLLGNAFSRIDTSKIEYVSVRTASAGGMIKTRNFRLKNHTFLFENYRLFFREILGSNTSASENERIFQFDGILGSDVFRHGKIRLDILNGRLDFENYN